MMAKKKALLIFFMGFGLLFNSCRPEYVSKDTYFETPINISAKGAVLSKNDTLWFAIKPNATLKDTKTNKDYTFQNVSYTLLARMEVWRKNFSTTDFLNNFQIVTQKGRLINYSLSTYGDYFYVDFGMRFGCPDENELKFGIVLQNAGIFSIALGGNIYHGVNRSNCTDYSYTNEYSYLMYRFKTEDLNWSIYDKLSLSEKKGTETYYKEKQRNERTTYFFEIKD